MEEDKDLQRSLNRGLLLLSGLMILICILAHTVGFKKHETKHIEVCDTMRMETYFISCLDEALKESDEPVKESERSFWMEECSTQAHQYHCKDVLHVWLKNDWINCDSLPQKKRDKYCIEL